jgi:peptide/nickel transport system permease protein
LLVTGLLAFVSVFATMLASDWPIACSLHGHTYILPNVTQPAELLALGPPRATQDATWVIPAFVAHSPETRSIDTLVAPSREHPFGTDREGRDVFARVVHGGREYVLFALGAVFASLLLGGFWGACAGLFGGATDALVGRAVETVSAFPPLVLVLGIQASLSNASSATLFLAIAVTRWPEVARLVRAEVVQVVAQDYVVAARALGASPWRVLRTHVVPHVRGPLIVLGALGVPGVILMEASLDFLRVSAVGSSSWGQTMSEFRDAPDAWWLFAFPGTFLLTTVLALSQVFEARRHALDPRGR